MADIPRRLTTVEALERAAQGTRAIAVVDTNRAAARAIEAAWADWRYLTDAGGYFAPNVVDTTPADKRVALLRDRFGFISITGSCSYVGGLPPAYPTETPLINLPETLWPEERKLLGGYVPTGPFTVVVNEDGVISFVVDSAGGTGAGQVPLSAIRYRAANAGEELQE